MADVPPPPSKPSAFGVVTGEKRSALLDAILENPESNEARLVYADQLIANNDPRGELILVEIALDGPLSIRKREQLAARRLELIKAHSATWWPYSASHWRTHRGFISAVAGTLAQVESIATALFAAEPVTDVELRSVDADDVESLLEASWLPRIHRLVLRGEIGDEGFQQLCMSSAVAKLRALNVTGNELTSAAFREMTDALPSCTNLVLTGNEEIGDDGLASLRSWKQLANVDTLYLSGCGLGTIDPLFAGPPFAKLAKLTLSNNELGDEGIGVLVKHADRMPELVHLELMKCGLSSSGASALAHAKLPKLRRLDLRRNNLDASLASDPRIRA